MICKLCGSRYSDIIYSYARFEKNNIRQCRNCDLVFLEHNKSDEQIREFYTREYREDKNNIILTPEQLFKDPVAVRDCQKRSLWINLECEGVRGKRIVEIGSASGLLLSSLIKDGANASGVEFNLEQVEYARNLGLNITTTNFIETGYKDLDAVVIFSTLEHVSDPLALCKSIYSSLKPGGKLLGEVPNQNDWRISVFDCNAVKRFHYDPAHYFYFSPLTLKELLHRSSFYLNNIRLSSVERYNSLLQLKRILSGYYNNNIEDILKRDVFAEPDKDLRIDITEAIKNQFNRMFEVGVNSELAGNCLRWVAIK